MAVDVTGFSPAEADQLRRAMGSKRSTRKMDRLRERFFAGAAVNGITGELAERIFEQIRAFSGYGFPEAHSMSFALLVYASAYLKRYHPAAFCAGLLNAQPMGFYSPQSLVADARRHGVRVRHPDLHASHAACTLNPMRTAPAGSRSGWAWTQCAGSGPSWPSRSSPIAPSRARTRTMAEFGRRVWLTVPQMEALATAGVFDGLGLSRRDALWSAGAAARERPHHLPGLSVPAAAPTMS